MAVKVVRYRVHGRESWGVAQNHLILPLSHPALTLREFIEKGGIDEARRKSEQGDPMAFAEDRAEILSPVTAPCQIVCLGKNYSDHVLEMGGNPQLRSHNLFFMKSSAALAPARGKVLKPSEVQLLDYEIELALILGRRMDSPISPSEDSPVSTYVAGIAIANDVTARDFQMSRGQWFHGKSFKTFCPMGPYLVFPDPHEFSLIDNLELELRVNGELRQSSNTSKMMFKPEPTLRELSQFLELYPGDIILTGTPSGVAMQVRQTFLAKLQAAFLSPPELFQKFLATQKQSSKYLKSGDVVEAKIYGIEGNIDLGAQEWTVDEQ